MQRPTQYSVRSFYIISKQYRASAPPSDLPGFLHDISETVLKFGTQVGQRPIRRLNSCHVTAKDGTQ